MYSQTSPSQSYEEYLIELENGHEIHYPFELVTFTSQRAFMRKLSNAEQRTADIEERELLSQTVTVLVAIYEENHPDHSVHTFTMNRIHIHLTGDEKTYTTTVIPLFSKEFAQ